MNQHSDPQSTANATRTRRVSRSPKTVLTAMAAVVLLPGLLSACSSGGSSDQRQDTGSALSSEGGVTSCLRDKGYDMPAPSSNSQMLNLEAPKGVDSQQWDTDLKACMGDSGSAGESGFKQDHQLPADAIASIASCIRENGFEDYPDDQDAQNSYQPGDQDTFQKVSQSCGNEVLADLDPSELAG